MIKSAIWKCVIAPEANLPKEEQKVELNLLRDLMKELKTFIDFFLHNTKKYRKVKKEYRVASVKQSKTLEAGYPEGSRKQIQ